MARLNVNGRVVEVNASPDTPLLWAIREHVGLTGTKYGCGIAQCGSCTVHIDGQAVRSCGVTLGSLNGSERIVTIEGLSPDGNHPIQRAWRELDVPQCGYCQCGQMMSAAALLAATPRPDQAAIRAAMAGNICRCGTYQRIEAAVARAAELA